MEKKQGDRRRTWVRGNGASGIRLQLHRRSQSELHHRSCHRCTRPTQCRCRAPGRWCLAPRLCPSTLSPQSHCSGIPPLVPGCESATMTTFMSSCGLVHCVVTVSPSLEALPRICSLNQRCRWRQFLGYLRLTSEYRRTSYLGTITTHLWPASLTARPKAVTTSAMPPTYTHTRILDLLGHTLCARACPSVRTIVRAHSLSLI